MMQKLIFENFDHSEEICGLQVVIIKEGGRGVLRMVRTGHAHLRLLGRGWSFLMGDIFKEVLQVQI